MTILERRVGGGPTPINPVDFPTGFLDSVAPPAGALASHEPPLRVLFVGNSLTFFHEMPRIFAALATAGTGRTVVVGLASAPGMPLWMLQQASDLRAVVQRLPWDYVVVQPRPTSLRDPLILSSTLAITEAAIQQSGRVQ